MTHEHAKNCTQHCNSAQQIGVVAMLRSPESCNNCNTLFIGCCSVASERPPLLGNVQKFSVKIFKQFLADKRLVCRV